MENVTLFRLQLKSRVAGAQQLYWRGNAQEREEGLFLPKGETVSFDTFFNLFSHAKYAKYCGIDGITLTLRGKGKFLAKLFHTQEEREETLLFEREFTDEAEFFADLSALPQEGFVWFSLTALSDALLFGGEYRAQAQTQPVKLAIVICTYKRENFVTDNIRRLTEGAGGSDWKERLHVFVIDNASTLALPQSELTTVFPNKNTGGSGGFTRGIMEVCSRKDYTHILLMDDDVCFAFETVEKTYALLRCLTEEHRLATVGGAMLILNEPMTQFEFGAFFDGSKHVANNSLLQLDERASLLQNEQPPKANYNAWFYCCIPVQYPQEHALPLPFFIKCDDIEYNLRCMKELIVMNGIALWHEDFRKKYSLMLEYYDKRNYFVTAALHSRLKPFHSAAHLLYFVLKQLSLKRYDGAELILRAVEDFLRGPEFFAETDCEQLNKELLTCRLTFLSADELSDIAGQDVRVVKPNRKVSNIARAAAVIENYLPAFLFSSKAAVCDEGTAQPTHTFCRRKCIYYNPFLEKGYVCELDARRRNKLRRRAMRLFFRFLKNYKKVVKLYKDGAPALCTKEAWEARLGISVTDKT